MLPLSKKLPTRGDFPCQPDSLHKLINLPKFCFYIDKKQGIKIIISLSISGGTKVAVKIRLQRVGTKKRPFYRVVAVDSRKKRDGGVIDQLGRYQPIIDGVQFDVNEDKVIGWLKKGAQPTDTMLSLLKKSGLWQKFNTAE